MALAADTAAAGARAEFASGQRAGRAGEINQHIATLARRLEVSRNVHAARRTDQFPGILAEEGIARLLQRSLKAKIGGLADGLYQGATHAPGTAGNCDLLSRHLAK